MVGPTRHRDAFGRWRMEPLTDDERGERKDSRYRAAMDKAETDGGRALAQVAQEDARIAYERQRRGE